MDLIERPIGRRGPAAHSGVREARPPTRPWPHRSRSWSAVGPSRDLEVAWLHASASANRTLGRNAMSSHHQTDSKPGKSDRRVEHHRERQATRAALHVVDLEEVLDPPSAHNIAGAHSEGRTESKHPGSRHWKRPFWVRRAKRPPALRTGRDRLESRSSWRRES